eukprot:Em0003g1189a
MELDENVQPASSRRSYTLSKDMLPPLETLVVTIVGSTELDGILSVAIPNRLLEDWANSRSTDTSFVALLNERIEDDIMSFNPDATRLETQLYRRSLSVASKLRKTRGAKRIDVLFGSTSTTIFKGELFPAAMLVEERSVANDLLAEADAMIYDLQNQLIFVRQELTEAHETLASQYCNKGGTTDIDNSDSTEANLKVLYPLDRFGIAKNPAVFASGKKKLKSGFLGKVLSSQERLISFCYHMLSLEPSIGQYLSGLGNHTIAVVKADSFVNVNGNPYPIELFLSSDMKFTLLTLGLNGANSIYACPFCTMHRDNRWDMSKAEAHFTNTVVRTLATLSESPPLNAADDIHQKHGSMKLLLQQPVGCPSRRQSTGWKSCVSMPEKGGLTLSIILHTGMKEGLRPIGLKLGKHTYIK